MAREDDDLDYDDEDEGSGIFRWLQAVVVLFALGGFFGLAWYAYKSGNTVDEKDVDLVRVDKAPVKEAPANPGGMQIPNQDKTVYGLIGGGDKNEKPVVERIVPPTEEPVKKMDTWVSGRLKGKEAAKEGTKSAALVKEVDASGKVKNNGTSAQFNPAKTKETQVAVAIPSPTPSSLQVVQGAVNAPAETEEPKTAVTPSPTPSIAGAEEPKAAEEPSPSKPVPAPLPPPPGKAENAGLPKVRIQLGALKSKEEAEQNWTKITKKFPGEMADKRHYVVRVTVHGNVYYRLQAAPFDSAHQAESFCMALAGQGQGCFVAKEK